MGHLVVVGGSSAIAQGVIHHYTSVRKWNVTAICRRRLPKVVSPLLSVVKADMSWNEAVVLESLPDIDLLITLTGWTSDSKLANMSTEQWKQVLDSNMTTVFHSLKYGIPRIVEGGSAIVTGSIVGKTGGYGCANYAAAKAGLCGLVRAAANENVSKKVRVNLLELGFINVGMGEQLPSVVVDRITPTIPMKRFGTVDEVLQGIEALERLTYMTGGILTLAGGL